MNLSKEVQYGDASTDRGPTEGSGEVFSLDILSRALRMVFPAILSRSSGRMVGKRGRSIGGQSVPLGSVRTGCDVVSDAHLS